MESVVGYWRVLKDPDVVWSLRWRCLDANYECVCMCLFGDEENYLCMYARVKLWTIVFRDY